MDKLQLTKEFYKTLSQADIALSETLEKFNESTEEDSEKGAEISHREAHLMSCLLDAVNYHTNRAKDLIQSELIRTTGEEYKENKVKQGFISPNEDI